MTQGATRSEFECPQCQARYKIVRVDAGLQTINRPVYCKVCRRPFTSREGEDILKYFLTDRPKTGSPRGRWATLVDTQSLRQSSSGCLRRLFRSLFWS